MRVATRYIFLALIIGFFCTIAYSDNKLSCNERMKLRYSRTKQTKGMFDSLLTYAQTDIKPIFDGLPEKMTICKFKGKLTADEMKQDLVFENAVDNMSYRETKIVW